MKQFILGMECPSIATFDQSWSSDLPKKKTDPSFMKHMQLQFIQIV
jgi:hypothetical protein